MRKRIPLATGALLLLAGVFLFIFEDHVLPGLSLWGYDTLLKRAARPVQTDAVVIVEIDDDSLTRYGQWPWPRVRLARLVSNLRAGGADVIVFDVLFTEPDRSSPDEAVAFWRHELGSDPRLDGIPEEERDFDALFGRALADVPVVLGCFLVDSAAPLETLPAGDTLAYRGRIFERGSPVRARLPQAAEALAPLPVLWQNAAGMGFINTTPDRDGVIRRTPLVFAQGPGRLFPSLALEALRLHVRASQIGLVYGAGATDGVEYIQLADRRIPTDAHGRLTVNYRRDRFPYLSAADVLDNRFDARKVTGRIVFVGASAAGLLDLVPTPLASGFPGVEVHATVVDNVLAGDALREPGWLFAVSLLTLLLIGIGLTVLVTFASALPSFLAMLLVIAGTLGAAHGLLVHRNLVVLPAETLGAWVLVFAGVTTVKYWQEERERRRVRGMFGTMVSPSVLRYLEENLGSFSLRGARAEATMFFSDVAGFTRIAENMAPERLAELLNRYLSPMADVIMARGGYVDKYEGDAIMAEWGVPYAVPDHAVQACYAAIEQQEALDHIRAPIAGEFGVELSVRMGVNSGTVTAGNMGSERRFQYTVMGDAVNLAARLEAANKAYGSRIMIGEATFGLVEGLFDVRLLDRIQVRGREQAVRVYELLGRAGALDADRAEVVSLYERALALCWERNFEEADRLLGTALRILRDAPALALRDRIRGYMREPPPPDWKGATVLH